MPTQEDKSKKLREEVSRRYETLPPELKQAMASAATAEAIYAIGKKFGLNIEKTGYLADIIGYTILGIFPIADFMRNLKNSLEVDSAKAEEISREVNNKIFLAIREQLKKTHGEKWDERAMTTSQETRDKRQETRETVPTVAAVPQAPTTPKSPWEIRPDGFSKPYEQSRTVVPPAREQPQTTTMPTLKIAEAEMKKATPPPPELPKTREAPQPAPAPRAPEVLKEIRPLQPTAYNQQPTTTPKPEMPKAPPPSGLPFIKEIEKLAQTPELPKPPAPVQAETIKMPQMPTPKPVIPEQIISPKPPQAPPTPQTQTPAQQKPAQSSPAPTPKYNLDPYREPIE